MKVYKQMPVTNTVHVLLKDELWALRDSITARREAADFPESTANEVVAEFAALNPNIKYWAE